MTSKMKKYLITLSCLLLLSINSLVNSQAEEVTVEPEIITEEVIEEENTEELVEESEEEELVEEEVNEELPEIIEGEETEEIVEEPEVIQTMESYAEGYPVSTFAELKDALSLNNGIESIYLTADIVMTSGITVHSSKKQIIINGTSNGVRYTLTEMDGAAAAGTIYIPTASVTYVKLMNINIEGKNYYGPVNTAPAASSGVVMEYENVNYHGPQITYNIYGTAIYRDSTILIEKTGISAAHEVAEITNVEFYGTNTITHTSTSNNIFYYHQSGKMLFHDDSITTVNANGNPLLYGGTIEFNLGESAILNYISAGNKLANDTNNIGTLILNENAKMNLEFNGTAAYSYGLRVTGTATIEKNAELSIVSNGPVAESIIYGPTSVWNINGGTVKVHQKKDVTTRLVYLGRLNINSGTVDFQVDGSMLYGMYLTNGMLVDSEGSFFWKTNNVSGYQIQAAGTTAADGIVVKGKFWVNIVKSTAAYGIVSAMPISVREDAIFQVMSRDGGPTTTLIYLSSANGYIEFVNPKHVYLYSKTNRLVMYYGTKQFNLYANQINYWLTATDYAWAGSVYDTPLFRWYKDTGENFWINMIMSSGVSGNITASDSNQVDGDGSSGWPGNLFNAATMRVLSLGYINVYDYNYVPSTNQLVGKTEPFAMIYIEYNGNETVIPADQDGNFSYQFADGDIVAGDEINLVFNLEFLFETRSIFVHEEGNLEFVAVPSELQFKISDIPSEETVFEREDINWTISIADGRTEKGNWKLYAKMEQPMTVNGEEGIPSLENSLVFIDANGQKKYLSTTEVLIFDGTEEGATTDITWGSDKGILFQFTPGKLYSNVRYSTTIEWILQDAP